MAVEHDDEPTNPGIEPVELPDLGEAIQRPVPPPSQSSVPALATPIPIHSAARAPSAPPPPPGRPRATATPIASSSAASAQQPQQPAPQAARQPIRMPEMGALEPFMKDPSISEIMVNDLRNVMLEKDGKLVFSGYAIQTLEELNRMVRAILDVTGRVLTPEQPYVDATLPDGSRINIVGPPVTVGGACITIRKFPFRRLTAEDLMNSGTIDRRIAYFFNACVVGKMNLLISGGTGSGKTTLLNVLASFVPRGERVVTIEDTPELAIGHFNSVRLQTKLHTPTSPGVSARDLVANALRMRPDRIIVGECRRGEAFDMLQAMNTGHEGSMTTLHANTPRDALSRIETLSMMAGVDLPLIAIRKQIASAIDLIIQVRRFRDGKRRVVAVSEITGMEGEVTTLQDIFVYDIEHDQFRCTGFVPTFVEKLREHGVELPANYFA